MQAKETIRYSEAFKQQVIGELERGKFESAAAATRAYRIRGFRTVIGWLRKYGRSDLMPRRITITTMQEETELSVLKKRVRQLEKALADTHMKQLLGEAYLEVACEELGQAVDEFKKKAVTGRSGAREAKGPT